ncbi:hypothetical protein D3P06_16065 [Paracoccus aestuarii]|uniref:Uncharacterized protein n=1 Tax=Paracoccus aestuarii TaxID=453842 RepID=A0A418ZQV8_9RHOB|nr:hypothetical protein [Paracoccus aestuarii]RJK98530.1 hypothetical protein D3P06_16065 [Paracoccus aestuarii]WCQ98666.1 hypothetical protein JHW48_12350 [Paracoccus aestuarii]
MIELFFVTCLAADPAVCRDRSLLYTQDVGLMTCMMGAQTQLAAWAARHPDQRVARWQCRMAGLSDRTA